MVTRYEMELWNKRMISAVRRKIAAERMAAALAVMKPAQLKLPLWGLTGPK